MHYAVPGADGRPVAGEIKACAPDKRPAAHAAALRALDTEAMIRALEGERANARKKGPGLFLNASFPTLGEQRTIVVLVEYTDVKFRLSDPADYFSRMLNQPGFCDYGATGSARDYYLEASGGRFDPHFDVYGPVTLPHPMAWYGGNEQGHDSTNARMMVVDACNALNATVDFSQYDRDGDGTIDNVFLFYAGLGEATGGGADTVWPHSADVLGTYTYDGKTLKTYGCTNEWILESATTGHPDAIGTFCHEFGHVLGLPDLYATTYPTPAPFTPGAWALMDRGAYNNQGRTPPALDIFSRQALGWYEPVVLDRAADVRLAPLSEGGGGYKVPTPDPDEFFLIENRQRTGWDRYIPGHGMLVWHVEFNAGIWMNHSVNNDARHQYVDILEADGTEGESSRAGDTFPGIEGVTAIECRVYESKAKAGEYWFEPQTQNMNVEDIMYPGSFIVHASNPNAVYTDPIWCQHPLIFCFFPLVPEIMGIQGSASYYGKVEDGVAITFPANSYIWGTNPTGTPVTNVGGKFMLYLPEETGICDITADDSEAVYYNLQGMRVDQPEHGIFIRKSGNSVKKVRK